MTFLLQLTQPWVFLTFYIIVHSDLSSSHKKPLGLETNLNLVYLSLYLTLAFESQGLVQYCLSDFFFQMAFLLSGRCPGTRALTSPPATAAGASSMDLLPVKLWRRWSLAWNHPYNWTGCRLVDSSSADEKDLVEGFSIFFKFLLWKQIMGYLIVWPWGPLKVFKIMSTPVPHCSKKACLNEVV